MTRFAIIIPLRPKSESNDWEEDVRLLERTVQSVLRQTYTIFNVYIVYTDEPARQLEDPRLRYVEFPYGHQLWHEMENREDLFFKFKSETKARRRWDKARKVCFGAKLAKEEGCDYIMSLDSDDLLSKKFLQYLFSNSRNNTCMGWYMDKGYLYRQHSRFLIRVPKYMCGLNGSTHVLRADCVEIPNFNSLLWTDYSLFIDHGWVRGRMEKYYNATLQAVPTKMLVYVVHRSNMSNVYEKEFGLNLKAIVKRIVRYVPLTKKLREEFNIFHD